MNCAVSCLLPFSFFNMNSPLRSVTVPIFVPVYATLAPMIGSPFFFFFFPFIRFRLGVAALAAFNWWTSESEVSVSATILSSCISVRPTVSSITGVIATGALWVFGIDLLLATISFLSVGVAVTSWVESCFILVSAKDEISSFGLIGSNTAEGISSLAMNTSSVILFLRNRK